MIMMTMMLLMVIMMIEGGVGIPTDHRHMLSSILRILDLIPTKDKCIK